MGQTRSNAEQTGRRTYNTAKGTLTGLAGVRQFLMEDAARRKGASAQPPPAPAAPQMSADDRAYLETKRRMAAIPETEEGRRSYLVDEKGSRAEEYGWKGSNRSQ